MPIYEYRCKAQGHRFELIQKFSDPTPAKCQHCDSEVEKLISSSAFVLKGSGFYVNDYAKKGGGRDSSSEAKNGTKGEAKGESGSEGKSDGKSDAKGETKSETKTETKADTKSDARPESKGSDSSSGASSSAS